MSNLPYHMSKRESSNEWSQYRALRTAAEDSISRKKMSRISQYCETQVNPFMQVW